MDKLTMLVVVYKNKKGILCVALPKQYDGDEITYHLDGNTTFGYKVTLMNDSIEPFDKFLKSQDEEYASAMSYDDVEAIYMTGYISPEDAFDEDAAPCVVYTHADEVPVNNEGKHRIISTAFGEVMLKPSENDPDTLDCYNGDNFDEYIGQIDGTLEDDEKSLVTDVETILF